MTEVKPLVLDVDGTFLKTDMLFECLWAGLGTDPLPTLRAAVTHFRHPERLKAELVRIAPIRTDLLPVNPAVADLALRSRMAGREVVLASASDRSLVTRLAAEYGLSERVFASDATQNLKGARKAEALVQAFGERGFDYAGDNPVDMAVWARAENAIVVGRVPQARELSARGQNVVEIGGGWNWRALVKSLRPHQWVKNVLLLLAMIAAHRFDLATLIPILWAIVAFSAAASSIYIVNDLLDLEADRLHPTKCRRPFASGDVPIQVGMVAFAGLAILSLGIAATLNAQFFGVVVLYMVTSLAYSLKLKRMRWIDISTLAALYTIRVVAGAAAAQVDVSVYMLIFIFPIFITLGCVKRLTELTLATSDDRLPGRGYGRPDRSDLLNVAMLGTFWALVIFFLYSLSDQGQELYPTTWILWVAMIPMTLWLVRMVMLGWYGKQDYDPIVFAMRDKFGIGLLMIILSLMFWAAGLWSQWFGG
ncbi:MAG: UbiA family prenyltransferase [Rhodobacteraceae bacterium]|jgi:4-hydroxybenzoate polyprenyltransferase/phosphoserine phosphatase|uniref:UbiA family prenyltransferase n=1 Tax=Albidovulum sp. TaxID=1872424 RepID=UPI00265AD31C|nr:UbiA family prenyltransferase [uncultured Defluviimonas sp.]MCC0069163.1 UbiA family prenyltransferase [Paracoccaceae bacterium]